MNILIISENFTMGGLETHIYTQYTEMKNNNNFVFAFGNYNSKYTFGDSKIYTGFNFKPNVTIGEFCDDVDKLVRIINENNIDVIHSHPFFSVFPATIASQITGKPIVYTYHGFSSYSFTNSNLQILLFNHFLESCINIVFSVSKTGEHFLKEHNNFENVVFLPNSIDTRLYKQHKILNNKHWALISRLDEDKYPEIIKLLQILNDIDIEKICIYGDGSCTTKLEKYIIDNNLKDKVILMGYYSNLYAELDGKYNGIIGIGRAAMEGLAMGYPTLIIGQNKISGIIDRNVFLKIKNCNFGNRLLRHITPNELNIQLSKVYKNQKKYNLSAEINKEFSSENVFNKYQQILLNLEFNKTLGIVEFYEDLKSNNSDYNDLFFESRIVYNIFKARVSLWIATSNVKNIIAILDNYYKLLDNQNLYINKINELENRINMLNNKINLMSSFKNKIIRNLKKILIVLQNVKK